MLHMIEKNPVSINYLLNNFAPTSPIAVWTSSYLNLAPLRYIIITWNSLSGYDYSAPNSYWSWIIKKALVTEQLTGIIDDKSAPHSEDFRNVGGRNLRRLDFKKTDEKGTVMNLYDIPVQFALLLAFPNIKIKTTNNNK